MEAVAKAQASVGYLIGFQFISRLLTFVLNLLIIRRVAPQIFGIGNVHLQLFLNIVLLLSRESFRRAIARCSFMGGNEGKNVEKGEIVRFAWLVVPVGMGITFATTELFVYFQSAEELETESYSTFLWITALAVFCELIAEPFWLFLQILFLVKKRVEIEAISISIRCVVVFLIIYFTDLHLLSFALAQVAYSICLLSGYLFYFHKQIQLKNQEIPFKNLRELFPEKPKGKEKLLNGELFGLTFTFLWQSIEKLLLQEGEKFVLKFTETLINQGTFSVISNLGSLVVRFLFLPIEEISFNLFSKLLSGTSTDTPADPANKSQKNATANENHRICFDILVLVLKFMILMGFIFVFFGPNYSYVALEILYGPNYGRSTSAPFILSVFCFYVLFLGVNGITEAMFSAAASGKQLRRHNVSLIIFSALYIFLSVVLVKRYETVGLIIANCLNMLVRICYSLTFIHIRFKAVANEKSNFSLMRALPNQMVIGAFVLSFVITKASAEFFYTPVADLYYSFAHIVIGAICFLGTLASIYVFEKDFIRNLRQIKSKKA